MNKKWLLLITLGLVLILATPMVGCTPVTTSTPSPSPTPTSAPGSISTSTGWTTFIIDDGLASNIVTSVIQDNQGILWVASDQGLTRFNDSRWEIYTGSLSNTHITCATRDKQGNLWFGTVNAGAFKYTGKEWQNFNPSNTNKGLPGEEIASILADNQDNLWFANVGNVGQRTAPIPYGVTRYNGTDWTSFLDRTFVTTIFQDNQGNLWLGTNVGVTRYDGSGWQTFTTADGLTDNYVVAIAQDSQGNLWFGTWSGGVSRYDGKNWRTFTREDGLVSNAIHCILKDDQGNLWFGAYSIGGYNGISCFNGTEWQSFNPWQGRGNYNILSIFQDNAGNLWFATSIGLVRYSPDVVQPSALTSSTPTIISTSNATDIADSISISPSPGAYLTNSESRSSEVLLKDVQVIKTVSDKRYIDPPWSQLQPINVGESILVVSGSIQNKHKENKEIAMYAEGYDANGKQVAWTLDAAHLMGVIGLHLGNDEIGQFTLHLNMAENIKSIRIFAGTSPVTPP